MPDGTATAHQFTPKLKTTLTEGYGLGALRKDVLAGLTVAIVALPLSMAIGVASGVSPERALYAAIIGGFLVSALGGSRYQIGGPAGAFIVLVSATVAQHGVEGLLLAVLMSGLMLVALGLSGLARLIKYVPHAVTVGFTCGIAVTILASQLRDFAGLPVTGAEPGHLIPKLIALAPALSSANAYALLLSVGSAAIIFALKRWRPSWPGMLIAVVAASSVAALFHFPVETIGTRFGGLPNGLPWPQMPTITWSLVLDLLPTALSFTLLGAVESLLSAKIADGMTKRKHRYNMEVLAQGIANVASAVFGGISVTGTIARTATNIRAGAVSPVSGIVHAIFLLAFLLVAAPLANAIPLAALAGLLVVVCWNMAEKEEFAHLLRHWPTATVLLLTFGLTLVFDLTIGIIAGCVASAAIWFAGSRGKSA
ncbi:SulP family inorganic anion transporter [Hyphomicrobium sp.]|uniref:SulP family inorganic anion transporter n=1 Tax=Hyphomicrobium sp. TaxID=82 RepID=UPI002D77F368|nr:SulP family inorganic anion transporter [Hyphomicrobium sp.]HET6389552.1 SulP family inorganic anion transporter [Hyphomicrobium sp.]